MSQHSLIRDPKTGALINNNDAEYQQLLLSRARKKEIDKLQSDINCISNELCEIKELLKQIIPGR